VYLAFDTETSGLDPVKHRILQLGAIIVDDNFNEISKGHMKLSLTDQEWLDADPGALKINGATKETWIPSHSSNEVSLQNFYDWIYKYMGDQVKHFSLLGYNIYNFDIPFLKELIQRYNKPWIFGFFHLDIMHLVRLWVLVTKSQLDSLKLKVACEHFGIPITNHHESLADVEATIKLTKAIIAHLREIRSGQKNLFK